MANKRIYDLTEDTAPASGDYIATDKSGEGAASKVNLSKLLLASGTIAGATSQAQTFTNGIIGPSWKPASDSTTALQAQDAAGTAVMTIDTTNRRVGIGKTPTEKLEINGNIQLQNSGILYWYDADGTTKRIILRHDTNDDLNTFIKNGKTYYIKDANSNVMASFTDAGTTGNFYTSGKAAIGVATAGGQLHSVAAAAGTIAMIAQAAASATANITEARNSAAAVQHAIGPTGQIKTNQAAANTNTPAGATAHQLPIYDAAGTLLGYIPVYGAAW